MSSLVLASASGACQRGGKDSDTGSSLPVGSLATRPDTSQRFIVSSNSGGQAGSMRLVATYWGRLVDVHDFDAATGERRLLLRDFLAADSIRSDGVKFRLDRDPFTDVESLTILHREGTPEFAAALAEVELELQTLGSKSLDPSELPPFSAVPRNAAVALEFDDLIDPESVDAFTVRTSVGYPPAEPFEPRVIVDPSHGDLVGEQFRSTRVLVDFTVSRFESLEISAALNAEGLPSAEFVAQPNVVVRLPTRAGPGTGQLGLLRNLSGRPVAWNGSGATDPHSNSLDVVRAFRSRGSTALTGDPDDGFLPDEIAPAVVGQFAVGLTAVHPLGAGEFDVDLLFTDVDCAIAPREGDLIELSTHWVQVARDFNGPLPAGFASGVRVRVVRGNPSDLPAVSGALRARFRGEKPECFVEIQSAAAGAPSIDARVAVRFSEPMNSASVRSLETFDLLYGSPVADALYERVVGMIVPKSDLREFALVPSYPLRHAAGEETPYVFRLDGSEHGVTDLAGNPLELALPEVSFELRPDAPVFDSGGIALRFAAPDENGDGMRELRGQVLYDLQNGRIKPRSVSHFSASIDPNVPTIGAMRAFTSAIQTPLSNHGSRMMTVWRYHDASFGLLDESTHNLDVEGLHYQPFSGTLHSDRFQNMEIALAHSRFLPDEATSGATLLPLFIDSGLVQTFDANMLEPRTVMHPAAKGHVITPSDTFVGVGGLVLSPWPVNRNVAQPDFHYWTWRDTGRIETGAPNGAGADTRRLVQVSKVGQAGFYPVNEVPTIGLPLLMEFRTWPDTTATGQNGFKIAIALNNSAQPYFRVFSTGGINPLNTADVQTIQPSSEAVARGGINPNATLASQVHTYWGDNSVYYGQADFVVRVSRAHTAWFDLGGASQITEPVFEPRDQPLGGSTQLLIAFRGASVIAGDASQPWRDAENLDAYGDSYTVAQLVQLQRPAAQSFTPQFIAASGDPNDRSWTSNPGSLAGSRFAQVRITFVGDAVSGLLPTLQSLGIAYRH